MSKVHERILGKPRIITPAGRLLLPKLLIPSLAALMAGNWVENIAKGRVVELHNRVDTNDPSASALILVPLSATTTEGEAQDYDNLSTFLGGTANEQTAGGWVRKTLTDAETAAIAVDDTNNRFPVAVPSVTWTGPTAGSNTAGLAVCYDADTAAGADTDILVLTVHDFVVTADGNDVVLNAGDYFRAS